MNHKILIILGFWLSSSQTALSDVKGVFRIADENSQSYRDLAPLGNMIGNRRYVGLGESVHASGGFIDLRFRMVRYLVEKRGFRAIAWETPWTLAEPMRHYVEHGTGSAAQAVATIFPQWDDIAVAEMLTWLRNWNIKHPHDPVTIFGFDDQSETWNNAAFVRDYLQKTQPQQAKDLIASIDKCVGVRAPSMSTLWSEPYMNCYGAASDQVKLVPEEDTQACFRGIDSIRRAVGRTSKNEQILQVLLDGIVSFHQQVKYQCRYKKTDDQKEFNATMTIRDSGMASNLINLNRIRNPSGKTIIWAHNWHLSTAGFKYDGSKLMGEFLNDKLGDDYFPIGFVGYRIATDWPGSEPEEEPQPPMGSLEAVLQGLAYKNALIDLKTNDLFPANREQELSIYAGKSQTEVPAEHFKALVFMAASRPCESATKKAGLSSIYAGSSSVVMPCRKK